MSAKELYEAYKSSRADSHDSDRRKKALQENRPKPATAQTWHGKLVSRAQSAASGILRSDSDGVGKPGAVAKPGGGAEEGMMEDRELEKYARESKFGEPSGAAFTYEDVLKRSGGERMRLLELLPGQRDDDVRCKLRTYALSKAPAYHALSYTWGSEEVLLGIYINDNKVFKATPNLRSALRHLRSKDKSVLLWIDAICINQHDDDEKSWQVDMMSKFYSSSSKTLIWIGPAFDDSRKALQVCRIFARAEEAERLGITKNPGLELDWKPEDKEQAQGSLKNPNWNSAVNTMLRKPYFSRVWVVQEAVLSPSAELFCGFESLEWSVFKRGVSYGFEKHLLIPRMFRMAFMNRIEGIAGVIPARRQDDKNNPAELLLDYLMCFRHRQATKPVDKVFSLLGFVENGKDIGIEPDYKLTPEQVFHNTTVQILKHTSHLAVLGAVVEDPKRALSLSWIADWRYEGIVVEPFHHYRRNDVELEHATGASKSNVRFEDNDTTLILPGHSVGKIDAISEALPMRSAKDLANIYALIDSLDEFFQEGQDWRDDLRDAVKGTRAAGEFLSVPINWLAETILVLLKWEKFAGVERKDSLSSRAYWQTLCAENYLDHDEKLTEQEFSKWYDSLADNRSLSRMPLGLASKSNTLIFFAHIRSTWKLLSRFPEVMLPAVGRRLARVNGKLALIPPTAMMGDEMLLCKGGKVPLAARRSGPFWKLLGESYVHGGVMQGDAFREDLCQELRFR